MGKKGMLEEQPFGRILHTHGTTHPQY
jgi:hypothetical protein